MSLNIKTITVTPFQQNCRLLVDTDSKVGVIVDPGGEAERIYNECRKYDVTWQGIWLTHSHLDHCGGVKKLKELFFAEGIELPLAAHPIERSFREQVTNSALRFGFSGADFDNCPEPELEITGNENISLGNLKFAVLYTPGHAPGHLCFYEPEFQTLIAGDTLFRGSIGRTDLPAGNHQQLLASISEKILSLPDDTKVLPGHGGDTTVIQEKQTNPFLQ